MKLSYLIAILVTCVLSFSAQADNCLNYPKGEGHGPQCGCLVCPIIKKYNGDRVGGPSPGYCAHGNPLDSCLKCKGLLDKIAAAKKAAAKTDSNKTESNNNTAKPLPIKRKIKK